MNNKSNQRQAMPAVVLYKKTPDGKSAQAAWYDKSVEATAKLFGDRQGLTVVSIGPDQAAQVQAALSEGPAADKGALALHVVRPDVLDQLLAVLAAVSGNKQAASAKPPPAVATPAGGVIDTTPADFPPVDPLWAALTVNMVVLAPELTDDGVPEGWWEAVITAIHGDKLTLRFRDYPEQAPVRRTRQQLAIMYPPPVRV